MRRAASVSQGELNALSPEFPEFRITVADLLELSLDQQAGLDGFVNRRAIGRPLDAQDFIALVEM